MKILTVIGARPQFIKAATVSTLLQDAADISEFIVHTGQHYDSKMSSVFFDELNIPKPSLNLKIGSGTHGSQTGTMLGKLENVLLAHKPDLTLVYGDTNSTLAGALASAKLNIPVAHVEAGLRSFNKQMPEEINRILTDHMAEILFTPTATALKNLENEGIKKNHCVMSGDVMLDACLHFKDMANQRSKILEQQNLEPDDFILATVHRAENTDCEQRIRRIISELEDLANDYQVVFPIHPRTQQVISNLAIETRNIKLIEPVGYLDMIQLEKSAKLIITDSGGVQKEAYFFEKPCITLREETEWQELLDCGWNLLFPPLESNRNRLKDITEEHTAQHNRRQKNELYGNGKAAQIIVKALKDFPI